MSKLRKVFPSDEWSKCCASLCKDCDIAKLYKKEYGKKKAAKKIVKDKAKVLD